MERQSWAAGSVGVACLLAACGGSNNLLLGRVEAQVGGHQVVVTDCYRTRVPRPTAISSSVGGTSGYRWRPCRDADIVIRGEELVVNGSRPRVLKQGDAVLLDHGRLLVNGSAVPVESGE